MRTMWEVGDVRLPLISASHLLQRRLNLVLDENAMTRCKNGDVIPLEKCDSLFALLLCVPDLGFARQGWTRTVARREEL